MADDKRTPATPGRLWRIALVVSLALNLAVAGVVIGAVISLRTGDGPARSFDLGLGPVSRALTPGERRDIARGLRQDRALRDVNPRRRMADMIDALKAVPFDPDRFQALMTEQSLRTDALQASAQAAFFQVITDMTAERRIQFADQLADEMRKSGARRSGG